MLSGTVTSKYVIDKAADVAGGYVEKKENVVNLLKQQEGVASNQVMLRVRFAEVSRSALQELGASLFTGATGYKNVIARSTTQQFAAPDFTDMSRTADLNNNLTGADGKTSLSDFLNLFIFSNKYNIGAVVRALQKKGLFQSLAEPNLIASNGKEASFLAGGEYPYPVVQPSSGGNSVTIMFKEFGVRLNFTPTVLSGDLINLKVKPEVSCARLQQRRDAVGLPRARAVDPSHRDRSRAAGRPDVRDRRPDEQHGVDSTMSKMPGSWRHPGARLSVQEPGVPEAADRAGRHDHAADHAPRIDRRVGGAARRSSSRTVGCAGEADGAARIPGSARRATRR